MSEKQLRLYRETPPTTGTEIPLRLRLVPQTVKPQAATPPVEAVVEVVTMPPPAPVVAQLELDDQIVAILDEPVPTGVTVSNAYRDKERALAAYFRTLGVGDARALHRRLTIPSPDDALAMRFSRLVVDRRDRLIAVLADARRREAMNRRA
ncbi:MAG TPA: hypothetical protein VIU61_06225 [Kofleriaceae bacterium]